jgi:RNA polymerase sigma factor (sigma-70 family)
MVITNNTIRNWVALYTDALYEWAFYKLSDDEGAKDIVQETFITAFEKIDGFEGKSNPKTWLFSILNHKIIDYYRKEFRNPINTAFNYELDLIMKECGEMRKDPGNGIVTLTFWIVLNL